MVPPVRKNLSNKLDISRYADFVSSVVESIHVLGYFVQNLGTKGWILEATYHASPDSVESWAEEVAELQKGLKLFHCTVKGKDLTANQGTVTTVLLKCKTALRMKNIRITVFMHVAYHVSANHMTRTT